MSTDEPRIRWLGTAQVAERLGMNRQGVLYRIRTGELPAKRAGHLYRVREDHVEAFDRARHEEDW